MMLAYNKPTLSVMSIGGPVVQVIPGQSIYRPTSLSFHTYQLNSLKGHLLSANGVMVDLFL
jgi:hypothetical protein